MLKSSDFHVDDSLKVRLLLLYQSLARASRPWPNLLYLPRFLLYPKQAIAMRQKTDDFPAFFVSIFHDMFT
jgi:hypothetical protein